MKLTGLARVKNEADIIEAFVRHHARLLDWITVVDNGSCDGTRRILDALVREGLPLDVVRDDTFAYFQSEIMTYFARASFLRSDSDRIFLLDADEFLRVASRSELEDRVRELPYDCHGLISWETYVPTRRDVATEVHPVRRIRHKRVGDPDTKIVLSRRFLDQPEARVDQGNHFLTPPVRDCLSCPIRDLTIGHFPVRSVAQLQTKALAWNAYIAAGLGETRVGFQWKAIYDRLMIDRRWSDEDLYELGQVYAVRGGVRKKLVEDPFPLASDSLRYANLATVDAFATALAELRRVASQQAAARRGGLNGREHRADNTIDIGLTESR